MDRITNHAPNSTNENKIGCNAFQSEMCRERMGICDGCPVNEAAWARLAAYEDTKLSPENCSGLNGIIYRMVKQIQSLQERIHAQKRDNRRLQAERNASVKAMEMLAKGNASSPCVFCRNAKPDGGCKGKRMEGFSCWVWKGVHDGKGGYTE